jgi:hypothetical protein
MNCGYQTAAINMTRQDETWAPIPELCAGARMGFRLPSENLARQTGQPPGLRRLSAITRQVRNHEG